MAEAFIGLSVLATLKDPPHAKVQGLVTDVAEQQLMLNQGTVNFSTTMPELTSFHTGGVLIRSHSDMAIVQSPARAVACPRFEHLGARGRSGNTKVTNADRRD